MNNGANLSPEATEDLGHIAGDLQEYVCLACGHLNPCQAQTCAACGAQMQIPWDGIGESYLTALDLVRAGQLSTGELRELLDNLPKVQSFYTAGTRYSVFG